MVDVDPVIESLGLPSSSGAARKVVPQGVADDHVSPATDVDVFPGPEIRGTDVQRDLVITNELMELRARVVTPKIERRPA